MKKYRKGATCCPRCHTNHTKARAFHAHQRELMCSARKAPKRRRARTGFAAMSIEKRRTIAKKGGRASARARGYR